MQPEAACAACSEKVLLLRIRRAHAVSAWRVDWHPALQDYSDLCPLHWLEVGDDGRSVAPGSASRRNDVRARVRSKVRGAPFVRWFL